MTEPEPPRRRWARTIPLLAVYHDTEWGTPERDDRAPWKKLMPNDFQAWLVWSFVGGTPIGSVIVHAWMQACGLVDDHEGQCFRRGAAA